MRRDGQARRARYHRRKFVVTRATLRNPHVLETRSLPKKFLGRVMLFPRGGAGAGTVARLVFEIQPLRYIVALLPFVVAMLIWTDLALPLAQAPLAMILAIALVEMKLLHYSDAARAALIGDDEAGRVLDALAFRGRGVLARVAAGQGIARGRLRLVIEQSEVARVAPLTLVSVQAEDPPRVLDLTETERAALATLFDADLTERDLHRANARDKRYIREIALEAEGVSATERMAARLRARAVPA